MSRGKIFFLLTVLTLLNPFGWGDTPLAVRVEVHPLGQLIRLTVIVPIFHHNCGTVVAGWLDAVVIMFIKDVFANWANASHRFFLLCVVCFLLYHYTIVIVKVKGSTVVFLKVFWNRRKLLVSKGLRRRRPAPLALSAYRARGYVNPASSLRPHHHEAQAHALALREERKGTRFEYSHQFRIVQRIPTTQDWAAY